MGNKWSNKHQTNSRCNIHFLYVEHDGINKTNTHYLNGLRPYADRIAVNRFESNSSRSLTEHGRRTVLYVSTETRRTIDWLWATLSGSKRLGFFRLPRELSRKGHCPTHHNRDPVLIVSASRVPLCFTFLRLFHRKWLLHGNALVEQD
jgi:hypothetical protein